MVVEMRVSDWIRLSLDRQIGWAAPLGTEQAKRYADMTELPVWALAELEKIGCSASVILNSIFHSDPGPLKRLAWRRRVFGSFRYQSLGSVQYEWVHLATDRMFLFCADRNREHIVDAYNMILLDMHNDGPIVSKSSGAIGEIKSCLELWASGSGHFESKDHPE
jgi:hypothetical protein